MNDPLLLAEKLTSLATLAGDATTEFEKAAVFAAAEAIAAAFEKVKQQVGGYAAEKVEEARWHICAAVGYDATNGHDRDQHVVWAIGASKSLVHEVQRLT